MILKRFKQIEKKRKREKDKLRTKRWTIRDVEISMRESESERKKC